LQCVTRRCDSAASHRESPVGRLESIAGHAVSVTCPRH
jgi:hypothetical protein